MKTLLFCMILLYHSLFSSIDLEDCISDFVLNTQRISIPGYPDAMNPSIISWNGRLLMSFRIIPDPKKSFNSEIGIVWLDEQFQTSSIPQILDLRPEGVSAEIPSRAEDGRLIQVGDSLYLVYDDNRDEKITKGGFRVYIAKLEAVGDRIIPTEIEPQLYFEGENYNKREKSWVPFVYQNELLLAYSLSPHLIFRYLPGKRGCETFTCSEEEIGWDWGVLRGGTPAIQLDEGFYLSFFHSSIPMKSIHSDHEEILHYFMGAYIFSREPPFDIIAMSPQPIIGKNFYHGEIYKPYWHPVRAIFPVGYLCNKTTFSVFYGRQDHEMWVITLDRQGLLDSLQAVSK